MEMFPYATGTPGSKGLPGSLNSTAVGSTPQKELDFSLASEVNSSAVPGSKSQHGTSCTCHKPCFVSSQPSRVTPFDDSVISGILAAASGTQTPKKEQRAGGATEALDRSSVSPKPPAWSPTGVAGVPDCFSFSYINDIHRPSGESLKHDMTTGSSRPPSASRSWSPKPEWGPTGVNNLPKSFSSTYLRNMPEKPDAHPGLPTSFSTTFLRSSTSSQDEEPARSHSPASSLTSAMHESLRQDISSLVCPEHCKEPFVIMELEQSTNGQLVAHGEERFYSLYVELSQALRCFAIPCKCLRIPAEKLQSGAGVVYLVTPGRHPEVRVVPSKKSSGRWQRPDFIAVSANDMLHRSSQKSACPEPEAAQRSNQAPQACTAERTERPAATVKLRRCPSREKFDENGRVKRRQADPRRAPEPCPETTQRGRVFQELPETEPLATQQKTPHAQRMQLAESEAEAAHYKEEVHALIKSKAQQANHFREVEQKLRHDLSKLSMVQEQASAAERDRKSLRAHLSQAKSELRDMKSSIEFQRLAEPPKSKQSAGTQVPAANLEEMMKEAHTELLQARAELVEQGRARSTKRADEAEPSRPGSASMRDTSDMLQVRLAQMQNDTRVQEAQYKETVESLTQETKHKDCLLQQAQQLHKEEEARVQQMQSELQATQTQLQRLQEEFEAAQSRPQEQNIAPVQSELQAQTGAASQTEQNARDQQFYKDLWQQELERAAARDQLDQEVRDQLSELQHLEESECQQRDDMIRQSEARQVSMQEQAEMLARDRSELQAWAAQAQNELKDAHSNFDKERFAAQRQIEQAKAEMHNYQTELHAAADMKHLLEENLQQTRTELAAAQMQSGKVEMAFEAQLAEASSELSEAARNIWERDENAQQRVLQYKAMQARLGQAESDLQKAAQRVQEEKCLTQKGVESANSQIADLEAKVALLTEANSLRDDQLKKSEDSFQEEHARLVCMQEQAKDNERERKALRVWLLQVQKGLRVATLGSAAKDEEPPQRTQESSVEVEGLEEQVSQVQDQVSAYIQAKILQEKQLHDMQEELSACIQAKMLQEKQLHEAQEELNQAQQNAEALKQDRDTLKNKFREDCNALEMKLEAVQTELREALQEVRVSAKRKLEHSEELLKGLGADFGDCQVAPVSQDAPCGPEPEAVKEAGDSAEAITELLRKNLSSMADAVEGLAFLQPVAQDIEPMMAVGATLVVVSPIQYEYPSAPDKNYDLRCGLHGVVTNVDVVGDVEVEWEGLCKRWLLKQDCENVKVLAAD